MMIKKKILTLGSENMSVFLWPLIVKIWGVGGGGAKITYFTERLRELQMYNQCFALRSVLLVPFLFLPLTAGSDVTGKEFDQKPNFVLMVVDDLGIGDIGCYGNDTIR